jgi:ABC-type transporter Mla subunit MlaD
MMKRVAILVSAAALAAALGAPAHAQFSTALDEAQATANEAKASQSRIDQLDDQTAALLNDYRANLKQLEAAKRYNASLVRNVEAQTRQIARMKTDIENVAGLQRAVTPLMEDMLARLGDIVEADLPFDLDERRDRVARLNRVMGDPDVPVAQRYRLIVEAYQIENEYGRTIGAYQGSIDDGGTLRSGEFLRVGRVALMFKTPDDSVLKIWDQNQKAWVNLPRSYLPDVRQGLRMAKEQTAPGLLPVPVHAPTASAGQ